LRIENRELNVNALEEREDVPIERLRLRLYVAGNAPNSLRAIANLNAIFREYLPDGNYELETIDILAEPLRALQDNILLTPTLVKLSAPKVSIVGDLSKREAVLQALGLSTPHGS
jgi:circadian clock protein KaiB